MHKRLRSALLLAVGMAGVAVASGLAASVPVTATVNAGSLSMSSSATPSVSVTLNGTDQTPTYTAALAANDQTGSGSGWNLTVTSTQFTTGGGSPKTLPTTASSISSVSDSCTHGTCTDPTNGTSYPVVVPAASSPPTAVKFYSAAANTGMGDFTVTPTVGVTIPANAYAGSYSSTLTIAVVSGP
jgi:WxL domain surface cell wall-binding